MFKAWWSMQENVDIIRTHIARVRYAKAIRKTGAFSRERISVLDNEAFVKILLLEDIDRLLKYHLDRKGFASMMDMNDLKRAKDIFNVAVDLAQAAISCRDYRSVWQNVHERALMNAAKRLDIPVLIDMGMELVRNLYRDTSKANDSKKGFKGEMSEDGAAIFADIEKPIVPPKK